MRKTIPDLEGYLQEILLEYPEFSWNSMSYVIQELNGVQQLYFERFLNDTAVFQQSHTSAFKAVITPAEGMAAPAFSDLLAVFLDDQSLALMDGASYRESGLPAATMENGELLYRAEKGTFKQLTVLYRQRPADVSYENGTLSGAVYIPLKHVPLLANKIRECVARSVSEYKDADYYAKAYNNWLTVLDGYENGSGTVKKQARAAL